jgi:HEPN domain-containing protein
MAAKKVERVVEGFVERARVKLDEAQKHQEIFHYAEAISAAQECIELSAKATFLLLRGDYPKTHEFTEEQFEQLLRGIPEHLEYHNFPRLYLLHRFWSGFYTVAKYGYEKLSVPAKDLFKKDEAALAIKHADEWYYAARALMDWRRRSEEQQ